MGKHVVCFVAVLIALSGCHEALVRDSIEDPDLGDLVRYWGPVRLALTAVLVAPGKDSGLPWDGPGSLPAEAAQNLREGEHPAGKLLGALFHGLAAGSPMGVVASMLPWAASAFVAGIAAPDVEVELSLNGQRLARAPKVSNTYFPTWSDVYTDAVDIKEYDQIEIKATDIDVMFDDHIGLCTSQGMPYVDHQGYASAHTFTCLGQLWAVALRIAPVARGRANGGGEQ